MVSFRDITETFREVVKSQGNSLSLSADRRKKVLESLILQHQLKASPFSLNAIDIKRNLEAARCFIQKHKRDYTSRHALNERQKDDIEYEIQEFLNECQKRIEQMKSEAAETLVLSKSGKRVKLNTHVVAHRHGIVLILSESLQEIADVFDQLRSFRLRRAIEKSSLSRSLGPHRLPTQSEKVQSQTEKHELQRMKLIDNDAQALQEELLELLDSTRQTESKVMELSTLNHALSTHILQQSHQIEQLYNEAVEATSNISEGNVEIKKTIALNSDSRVVVILCFSVLIFGVLFLDWYNSR